MKKEELLNTASALYDLTLKIERYGLRQVLFSEAIIDAVFYTFDFKVEWICAIGNCLLMFIVLFRQLASADEGQDIHSLILGIKRNSGAGLLEWYGNLIRSGKRATGMNVFAPQTILAQKNRLQFELKQKLAAYAPHAGQPPIGLTNSSGNPGANISSRSLFYLLTVVAAIVGFRQAKEHVETKSTEVDKVAVSNQQQVSKSDTVLYTQALKYASLPTEGKQCKTLVEINNATLKDFEPDMVKKEKYITVYAVKATDFYSGNADSNGFYNTRGYNIWVFTRKDFFDKYRFYAGEDSVYRVKQLLGLPPGQAPKFVVAFLVNPKDLFRPCLNTQIDNSRSILKSGASPASVRSKFVADWYDRVYHNPNINENYPFTRLGYTLDWSPYNFSHIGVSEFVIDTYKEVKLVSVMPLQDFLRKGMQGYKTG